MSLKNVIEILLLEKYEISMEKKNIPFKVAKEILLLEKCLISIEKKNISSYSS